MNWFKHGWKLKLISLVLAVGLWYYAVNEESVEITRVIPLHVNLENENMSILKVSTDRLRVTMKVPRAMVTEVASTDIRAEHNLEKGFKQAGEYSFRTDAGEISLPSIAVHVIRIDPPVVQVLLDEVVVQKLPVKANFSGEPAFGYQIREDEVQLDPNAVMVKGPKRAIEKMTAVLTEPVDLTGRTRSFRITTGFQMKQAVRTESAEIVRLNIPIHEVSEEKQLDNITVKMVRPSGALGLAELTPQKISVVFLGPRRVLQNLEPEKMHAYADLSGLDYGEHMVDVAWILPPGVTVKDDKRIQIKALIRREK